MAPPSTSSKKRRKDNDGGGGGDDDDELEHASKASRRSARRDAKPSHQQLLRFLLTPRAAELVRPDDEKADIQRRGDIATYSTSVLTPFQELLCAVILSRPISHRLGLRSIRTLLNDPYNFTTPRAIRDAGEERRHQALWEARTQHKAKTADQLGAVADLVLDKYACPADPDGTRLSKALQDHDGDVDGALASLRHDIKGLGNTGLHIFLRRVQWLWHAAYPYVDPRTMDSLRSIGLSQDAEELRETIDLHWKDLGAEEDRLAGDDEAARKRRAFVLILERVVAADLENKINDVLAAAVE